jgi:polysaccharide biosynthesis protein VpsJ
MDIKEIDKIIRDSIRFIQQKEYRSYDVYDALTNPLINKLTRGKLLLRRIFIQLNAHSPVSFRFLGMKAIVHTKALSDMLSVYSLMYTETKDKEWLENAELIYQRLMDVRLETKDGIAWGLRFPYTSRFVDASEQTPNLYNTTCSALAILDYYETNPTDEIKKKLLRVIDFIFNTLEVTKEENGVAWIRYYPLQTRPIYNVNAMVGSFFVRINHLFKEEIVKKDIIDGIINLLKLGQNPNGSWYYSSTEKGRWVDGFHTGFLLESLAGIYNLNKDESLGMVVRKGFEFFRENLLSNKLIPKYFDNHLYPIEAQNCAQAIQTLAICSRCLHSDHKKELSTVIQNVNHYLYNPKGYYYFKKERVFTYRQYFMRWCHTPMVLALVHAKNTMR